MPSMSRLLALAASLVALLATAAPSAARAQLAPGAARPSGAGLTPVRTPRPALVAVAARPIARGAVLEGADIAMVPDTLRAYRERPAGATNGAVNGGAGAWQATGPAADAANAPVQPGWVARRPIAAGEPLRAPAVAPPVAVRYGQAVRCVYRTEGLAVTVAGTAVADAPVGARVAVRVEGNGRARRLEGTVIGPALVQLD